MRFKNKVAIITGGRQGIGFAAAAALSTEGAQVIIVSRSAKVQDSAQRLTSEGLSVYAHEADISDEDAVKELVATCASRYKRIDYLINNAGVAGVGPIETVSLEDWDQVMRNNLTSAFLCAKHVFPIMKQQKSGAIVNVSSIAGRSYSQVAGVHYTASKAGMIGFTRQLAIEGAPFNIRVNAVAPSQTSTEMLREGLEKSGKNITDIAAKIPLGKIAEPEQVASVIAFLCSNDSSYVTGAVIDVNGGVWSGVDPV